MPQQMHLQSWYYNNIVNQLDSTGAEMDEENKAIT